MFENLLRPEAPFTPDLDKLGYFLNDEGEVRSLRDPSKGFHFYINRNFHVNEVNREAMHTCMRAEYSRRFEEEGLVEFYLPQLTETKPKEPHVPILMTAAGLLGKKKRVLVIMNESSQDLGIWTWRHAEPGSGAMSGTALGLVDGVKKHKDEQPGIIVLNPGQLRWSNKYRRAVTDESRRSLPRQSAFHHAPLVHPKYNLIPGNDTPENHLRHVFDNVIFNSDIVAKDAEIYLVGLGSTGPDDLLQHLNEQWPEYSKRITAIGFTSSLIRSDLVTNPYFKTFLAERARAWTALHSSVAPLDTCIGLPKYPISSDGDFSEPAKWWPAFSCGDGAVDSESIFPLVYRSVLNWFFNEVASDVTGYKNPSFEVFKLPEDGDGDELVEEPSEIEKAAAHAENGMANLSLDRSALDTQEANDGDVEMDKEK